MENVCVPKRQRGLPEHSRAHSFVLVGLGLSHCVFMTTYHALVSNYTTLQAGVDLQAVFRGDSFTYHL